MEPPAGNGATNLMVLAGCWARPAVPARMAVVSVSAARLEIAGVMGWLFFKGKNGWVGGSVGGSLEANPYASDAEVFGQQCWLRPQSIARALEYHAALHQDHVAVGQFGDGLPVLVD